MAISGIARGSRMAVSIRGMRPSMLYEFSNHFGDSRSTGSRPCSWRTSSIFARADFHQALSSVGACLVVCPGFDCVGVL
jgi:hypothetical protein